MCEDEHTFIMDDLIIRAFEVKDYFFAFLVDAIVNERIKAGGRHKKLVTHLKNLSSHCEVFASRYDLNIDIVQKASTYITRMSRSDLIRKINITLSEMKRDIRRGQLGIDGRDAGSDKLYSANEIVEYYYVELWDNYGESEDIQCL